MTASTQTHWEPRSADASPDRDRDLVDQYLREVGAIALLTSEEELAVGQRLIAGDESAVRELVSRNLRFVVTVAKKYQHRGLSLSDLVGEGNVGLISAAEKFDPKRGVKFISYAVWWIRQSITTALARQGHIVRIPSGQASIRRRVLRSADALRQDIGHEPTQGEIAEATGLSLEEVDAALCIGASDVSLDAPVDEDGDQSRLDLMSNPDEEHSNSLGSAASLASQIERALGTLPPRDARILRMHFGLEGGREHTLEEIAAVLGITRERVRQLRDRGLRRLRHGEGARSLAAFAPDQSAQSPELPSMTGLSVVPSTSARRRTCGRLPSNLFRHRVRAS
jgi:RNA polymerase primary sigma factor